MGEVTRPATDVLSHPQPSLTVSPSLSGPTSVTDVSGPVGVDHVPLGRRETVRTKTRRSSDEDSEETGVQFFR